MKQSCVLECLFLILSAAAKKLSLQFHMDVFFCKMIISWMSWKEESRWTMMKASWNCEYFLKVPLKSRKTTITFWNNLYKISYNMVLKLRSSYFSYKWKFLIKKHKSKMVVLLATCEIYWYTEQTVYVLY